MKTVVISGATGFIGEHLVPYLVEAGYRVWVVQRATSQRKALPDVVGTIEYDGSMQSLQSGLQVAQPQIAIHLASLFLSTHTATQVEALVDTNLGFATKFLDACVGAGVSVFINTGTAWQRYENESYRPVNLYAATKEAFECILAYYEDLGALKVVTIRLGDTYGTRDPRKKLVSLLVQNAVSGGLLEMSGGEQVINLVYVDDVCRGFLAAIEYCDRANLPRGLKFALRGNECLSIKALVAKLESTIGRRLNVVFGSRPYREREVFHPESLTPVLPTWRPQVQLEAGLRLLLDEEQKKPLCR